MLENCGEGKGEGEGGIKRTETAIEKRKEEEV